ncbi:hypothetical protein Agabi119p4_10500 [Agaricus bisporus var. burnettii]|uniref:Major facilitator superfamily (MFS) profile domain-containing protein n=1 Tax=Agaricus bisporus var. burnettii TaxID=192524 RepID=A0A8H7C342_AGABI|nr:hypothetical protein Agabi119p4_10500 [Agaricus bisporus var. burnettii]
MVASSSYKYQRLAHDEAELHQAGASTVLGPERTDFKGVVGASSIEKKPYFGMTGTQLNIWVTVACTTAMTLFGYDQGVFGGIIVTPDFLNLMGNPDANLQGTIVSLYDIGCFFGAISTFMFGEQLGRKKTFIVGVFIMSVGAIFQTCSCSVAQIIVARLITGFGNGINTATAPVWQSETSKPSWRGKLVVFEMIMNIAGFSLSNWMTYGFSFVDGSLAWRFPIAFQLVFSVILFCTVPWLPESPRWLLAHGFEEEGVNVLVALEGSNASAEDEYILSQKGHNKGRYGRYRHDTKNGFGSGHAVDAATCRNQCHELLPPTRSPKLRRTLKQPLPPPRRMQLRLLPRVFLLWSRPRRKSWPEETHDVGCSRTMFSGSKYGAGATLFFFIYYIFFGICWQGVPWLYPTEINSLSMRTKGAAVGTASNWISNYLVVQITPIGIASLGWKFYIIWIVFNFVFIPLVWLVYPETANRHLEDIDKLYRENKGMIFVFNNKEAIQVERPQKFIDADTERTNLSRRRDASQVFDDAES